MQLLITHNALVELTHGVQLALYGQRDLFSAYHARVAPLSTPHAPAEQAPRFTTPGPEVAASTLEELHREQVGWHRRWAEGMNEWLTKKGKTPDVNTAWPL